MTSDRMKWKEMICNPDMACLGQEGDDYNDNDGRRILSLLMTYFFS